MITQQRNLLTSMQSDEWYTPEFYIEKVRYVLGTIELDPASTLKANEIVKARRIYTKADDGLLQEWNASTVFLNPPYNNQSRLWIKKLLFEQRKFDFDAIALIYAKFGYNWFNDILQQATVATILNKRIAFSNPDKENAGSAKHASAFVLLTDSIHVLKRFIEAFPTTTGKYIHGTM